jgi:hypothetical protein
MTLIPVTFLVGVDVGRHNHGCLALSVIFLDFTVECAIAIKRLTVARV